MNSPNQQSHQPRDNSDEYNFVFNVFTTITKLNSDMLVNISAASEQIKILVEKSTTPPTRSDLLNILTDLKLNIQNVLEQIKLSPTRQNITDILISIKQQIDKILQEPTHNRLSDDLKDLKITLDKVLEDTDKLPDALTRISNTSDIDIKREITDLKKDITVFQGKIKFWFFVLNITWGIFAAGMNFLFFFLRGGIGPP